MKYFNGFSLFQEEELFSDILYENDFNVAGFSYGAIKALKYCLTCKERIDTLQLISPAFFQNKSEKFKKFQMRMYEKDKNVYSKNFLKNAATPSSLSLEHYFQESSGEQLQELLNYDWDENDLKKLKKQGVLIEVYLGSDDKIVDAWSVSEFFQAYATIYIKKEAGHILRQ